MNATFPTPVVPPPQTTRETILARLEGVHRIYEDGVSSAAMWGYCATGNLVNPFSEYRLGVIRREWDESQRVFHAAHPLGISREDCLVKCVRLLELWLRRISPDVHTLSIKHSLEIQEMTEDQLKKI